MARRCPGSPRSPSSRATTWAARSPPTCCAANRCRRSASRTGATAVIGRNAAVFDFGKWRLEGWFAWVLWAIIHVYLLIGFENRMLVSVQWVWRYLMYERGARLIATSAPMPPRNFTSAAQAALASRGRESVTRP